MSCGQIITKAIVKLARIPGRLNEANRDASKTHALSNLFRREAVDGELVTVGVTGVGSESVRCAATRSNRAFVRAAQRQRGVMKCLDCRTVRCLEADGDAIADASRLTIGGLQDEEARRAVAQIEPMSPERSALRDQPRVFRTLS
jgi:hypothetical protein